VTGGGVLPINRRKDQRYPIGLKLHYKTKFAGSGTGEVANISSSGIYFQTQDRLPVGARIDAAMNWPFLLDGRCPLQLCIRGHVLRSNGLGIAVSIGQYEFHTVGTADHDMVAALVY